MRMRNEGKYNPIEVAGKLVDDPERMAETRIQTLEHLIASLSKFRTNTELERRTFDETTPKAVIVSSEIHWRMLNMSIKALEAEIARRVCSCGAVVAKAGMPCSDHADDSATYDAITRAALRSELRPSARTGMDDLHDLLTFD